MTDSGRDVPIRLHRRGCPTGHRGGRPPNLMRSNTPVTSSMPGRRRQSGVIGRCGD